ncbi:caspase family protein [Brevundimonas sp.]|uniref:caspase family protein n=1 Tax=Brevundimonas sp. TaxID=1871086 RepID=UPI001AD0C70D|nr:caspase family protein [Brevundimonas sp.]MBN9466987.1 caspase family protein [Brevundimonas sp.]
MAPTSRSRALAVALAVAAWAVAGGAVAESHALLIGVGRYAELPRDFALAAPALDVARLGGALRAAGLNDAAITVLSDKAGPAGATRTDILGAFADLTHGAESGDKVLIYFSGHGGRRPARAGDESDALEEVWLASDATVDAEGRPDLGAVSDHEVAAAVAGLRRRGVDVWLVVDACYGAGVTRGDAAGEGVAKTVSRAPGVRPNLEVPTSYSQNLRGNSGRSGEIGAYAGFYAAPEDGLAIATDRGSVFSNALARSLDAGRTRSLRDLAAGLLSADGRLGPNAPRPVFEGDLDDAVLDLVAGRQRRFGLTRRGDEVVVAAGAEEGLTTGERVVLENEAAEAIGNAEVTRVGIGRSLLQTVPPTAVSARLAPPDTSAGSPATRILAAIAALNGGWSPESLTLVARLERGGGDVCDAPVDVEAPSASATPVSLFALPDLQACDRLYLDVANSGSAALDVNLLYLSADGSVVGPSLHPVDSVRLAPGERRAAALRITAEARAVTEHLAIIALPAATRFPADLRYLSGPADRTVRALRGGDPAVDHGLSTWLAEVLDADARRGAASGPPPGQAPVAVAFPVVVRP